MAGGPLLKLNAGQRLLLACAIAVALGLPLAGGFLDMNMPLAVAVQQRVAVVKSQVAAGFVHVAAAAHAISAPLPARHLPRLKLVAPQALPAPQAQPEQAPSAPSDQAAQPAPISAAAALLPAQGGGSDLDLAVASSSAPEFDYPTGEGALVAISCRTPKPLPDGSPGPKLCMHNHYWALLRSAGLELSADGKKTFNPAATRRS